MPDALAYLHASPADLAPGTVLRPTGASSFSDGRTDGVYLSADAAAANDWAWVIGAGRHPRVNVYEVAPSQQPVCQDSGFYGLVEHVAPAATVVRLVAVVDTAAPAGEDDGFAW